MKSNLYIINVYINNCLKLHPAYISSNVKGCGETPAKWEPLHCMIVEIQHEVVTSIHWWRGRWPTGIVLQHQSVWNVCGQWWRGHDASPRSIQGPTRVFVLCCTWSWPSHMPSRSHYSDCPLWQKLKVPAKREMTKHIQYIQQRNLYF